jgi:hypothetical protein
MQLPSAFRTKFFPPASSTHSPPLPPGVSSGAVDEVPSISVATTGSTKREVPHSSKKNHVLKTFIVAAFLLKLGILDERKCFPKQAQGKMVSALSSQEVLALFQKALSNKEDCVSICPLGLLHSSLGQGANAAIPNCQQVFRSKIVFVFLVW